MKKISISLEEEQLEAIDERLNDENTDADSRSEAVRSLIDDGLVAADNRTEFEEQIETLKNDYEKQIADLEATIQRLENEKHTLINDRQERTELVRYAESQREKEQHNRERRQYNAIRRAWWWLAGEPADVGGTDESD